MQTEDGAWNLRGFIDIARRVYSLTSDTKVISKALELMLTSFLINFFEQCDFAVILASEQNQYPDFTVVKKEEKYALDLKSCYRIGTTGKISSFTLGAFTGYFRQRSSAKNIVFPYQEYRQHYVLGVVYTEPSQPLKSRLKTLDDRLKRFESNPPEDVFNEATALRERLTEALKSKIYSLDKLAVVPAAIHDIELIFYEKWRIASDQPGSGNTKNIGPVGDLVTLRNGMGIFTNLRQRGENIFNNYWMNYLTNDMARAAELQQPLYRNLHEYLEYRGMHDLLSLLGKRSRKRNREA
ncbi:MAG: type II restriction endonuclease [Candidatus Binatia bacterium]